MKKILFCRVCGLQQDTAPWGEDNETPNFEICPCCGVEFGYEDSTIESTRLYRAKWLENGAKWFMESRKPRDWNFSEQIKTIPYPFAEI